jgi:hypothetical protein
MPRSIRLFISDSDAMMKNKVFSITFFLAVCIVPSLFFIIKPKEISEDEKRTLGKWPVFSAEGYTKGTWAKGVDAYINDHFPFRDKLVSAASGVRYAMGIQFQGQEKVVVIDKKNSGKDKTWADSLGTPDDPRFLDDFEEAYSGSMLILNGKVYTLNTGSPKMSPAFARMVSEYAAELQGKTRVFSCVAPLSSAFIPAEKYKRYNTANKNTLQAIGANLTDGAIFCDVFSELNNHYNEYLFYGSDHHWTGRGAYYAYVSFCRAAGLRPVGMNEMVRKTKYPFLGSLYQLTRDETVRKNPDTVEYFMPRVSTTAVRYNAVNFNSPVKTSVFCEGASGGNGYSTFICGDAPLMKITTDVKNGRKAAVVKNSMGNAFAVYLISHYEEIYVVDFRYSKHNLVDLIRSQNIDDLIFALGMYGAMSNGTINMMRNLAKHKGTSLPVPQESKTPADSSSTPEVNPSAVSDTINRPAH